MPELVARSGLEQLVVPGRVGASTDAPGVTIALVQDRALAAVLARKNRAADLASAVHRALGLDLPVEPRVVTGEALSFVWAGPARWLAMAERVSGEALLRELRAEFADLCSVIDQSDARILVRVSGPRARNVLVKGILIDLHPRAFAVGDAAMTNIGHVRAHFWQTGATPTYEIAVPRSYAADFWHWLIESAAAYGVLIEAK
jgi:sarcosine oxidase subunit gamma